MTCQEAANVTRLAATTIRDRVKSGKIKGVSIWLRKRMGKDIFVSFPTLDAVSKLQDALREANCPQSVISPPESTAPPLIHPSDSVCLHARRELWRRNNRKFRRSR